MTVAVTGFAAFASPWVLLVLPTFAWRFAGDNPYYWGVGVALLDAADGDRRGRRDRCDGPAPAAARGDGRCRRSRRSCWSTRRSRHSPTPTPTTAPSGPPRPSASSPLVPDGDSVETDIAMMSHLAADHDVTWIGTPGNATPTGSCSTSAPASARHRTRGVRRREVRRGLHLVEDRDGYLAGPPLAILSRSEGVLPGREGKASERERMCRRILRDVRGHLSRPGRTPSGAAVVRVKVPAREERRPARERDLMRRDVAPSLLLAIGEPHSRVRAKPISRAGGLARVGV